MKKVLVLLALLAASASAWGQTPVPTQTFSLTASPIALPGGKQTVSGSISGATLLVTKNLELRDDNLVAPANNLLGFYGGINYHLPFLSNALNNASPNLNGLKFDFYLTGGLGVDRISHASYTEQHYSALAGGGVAYKFGSSGAFSLGVEARAARLPGLVSGWTAIVSVGPTFHW